MLATGFLPTVSFTKYLFTCYDQWYQRSDLAFIWCFWRFIEFFGKKIIDQEHISLNQMTLKLRALFG